jgi:hypothetical protein
MYSMMNDGGRRSATPSEKKGRMECLQATGSVLGEDFGFLECLVLVASSVYSYSLNSALQKGDVPPDENPLYCSDVTPYPL